jgi:hypothetical protein
MAVVTSTSVSLVNTDGSNLRPNVLIFAFVNTASEYSYYPNPFWAIDGSKLGVVIPPGEPMATPVPPYSVWTIPVDGSAAISSGNIPALPYAWADNAISPDLNKIGYAKPYGLETDNIREIQIANFDTTADTLFITGEQAAFDGWLPNSSQFVFKINSGPDMGIHVGTVGGGFITLSTAPNLMFNISWPDSTHYLYLLQNSGSIEIHYTGLGGSSDLLLDSGDIMNYEFIN